MDPFPQMGVKLCFIQMPIFIETTDFLQYVLKAKLFQEAMFFHHQFYLPEVNIRVQNGHGVLYKLVPRILDMGLASMAILDLYIYFRY